MTQEDIHSQNNESRQPRENERTDAASRSLSDALKISFFLLKLIMIALAVFVIQSGFQTIGPDEAGIVLRFGKIRGQGEQKILKSRPLPYWIYPYPLEQLVKIPVEKNVTLKLDSFWYYLTERQKINNEKVTKTPLDALRPLLDGYNLVRGGGADADSTSQSEGDYNIVHTKWTLEYKIDDPEKFFTNVYIDDVKSGQIYFDVMTKSIKSLLTDIMESCVVTALVNYTIEEVKYDKVSSVAADIRILMEQKLDAIDSGIRVVSLNFDESTWPLQVDFAFQEYLTASTVMDKLEANALSDARKILNEAGGPETEQILRIIKDPNAADDQIDFALTKLAGKSQDILAQARAYKTTVVQKAEANADYLTQILPEFEKRPQLILHDIYTTAMEKIFKKADERIILQPVKSDKGNEVRILINKNPNIKKEAQPAKGD